MIKRIINTLSDYIIFPGITPDEREKRRIAISVFLIAALIFIPLAFYNIMNGNYISAAFNITSASVMAVIFFLLRHVRKGDKIYRIGVLYIGALFLYILYKGGSQGGYSFWSLVFPLSTFFMLGIKEGGIWNITFLSLSILVMHSSYILPGAWFYTDFFISRFTVSYIAVSLLTIGYENARSTTLAELLKEQKRIRDNYNSMKAELELSKRIQKNIIPGTPPDFKGIQIASFYKPLGKIGGDFYDYILMTSPARIGFFIADVTGHGVPSALITSMLKILIATSGKHRESTSEMLFYINKHLYEKSGGYLATAFYCIYDPAKMTLTCSRGGHSFPYLIRNGSAERIVSEGYILGAKKNPVFEIKKIQLQKGDRILLFTDGLIEAENSNNTTFETVISEKLLKHSDRNINDFIKNIFGECTSFKEGENFDDDISIIGIDITSKTRAAPHRG